MDFVHLHAHSSRSLLDGLMKVSDAVEKAAKLGMEALAITDHGSMWGCADLFFECRKLQKMSDDDMEEKGYKSKPKAIIGMEAYYASGMRQGPKAGDSRSKKNYHMVLLARDKRGWNNLCKMHYQSFYDGFYYKPRIDMDLLEKHGQGLIILSACMAGYPQQELLLWKSTGDVSHYNNAKSHVQRMKDLTNGHYYLEAQDTGVGRVLKGRDYIPDPQRFLAEACLRLSEELDVPMVLTNDSHFLNETDKQAHRAILRVGGRGQRDDGDAYDQNWFKSAEEMSRLYPSYPEWMENTIKIARQCDVDISNEGYIMPDIGLSGDEATAELERLVEEGLARLYGDDQQAQTMAEYELDVISRMGFANYFLIVHDLYREAKRRNISTGLGRGSAAGSVVSYCLGITRIDPIEYDLLFERFLNPDRISMPDIDMDFPASRRAEMVEYAREKYGHDNVAVITTFQTMGSKQSLRDMGRVHNADLGAIDKLAKAIPVEFGKSISLDRALEECEEVKRSLERADMKQVWDDAVKVEGTHKSIGVHPAGVIITPRPSVDYLPCGFDRKAKTMTTSFADSRCEDLGLLKLDFLGLDSLDIYEEAKSDIRRELGIEIIDEQIPFDDSRTWEMFRRGHTNGVFQMEAAGFQEFCKHMEPDNIEDVIAMVALYRPGPLKSKMHIEYKARKNGAKITYWPKCEKILKPTYGLMVYQEQLMQISRVLCGFTLAQADVLRKAVGKKKKELLEEQGDLWKSGARKIGLIDEDEINHIWDNVIIPFAQYGFNRSHSAAYGIFAYRTAWMKANFPVYYMKAMMNNRMDESDRLAQYVQEARQMGIRVEPPDINRSYGEFKVVDGGILFSLSAIKEMSHHKAQIVTDAQRPFKNIQDFCNKINTSILNSASIEKLIAAGCFSELYANKEEPLAKLEYAIPIGKQYRDQVKEGGFSDLAMETADPTRVKGKQIKWPAVDERLQLDMEYKAIGFFLSDSPMRLLAPMLEPYYTQTRLRHVSEFKEVALSSGYAVFAGVISELQSKISKNKNQYWRFILTDDRSLSCVAFDSLREQMEEIENGQIVVVEARAECPTEDDPEEEEGLIIKNIRRLQDEEDLLVLLELYERVQDRKTRQERGTWRNDG